MLEVRLHCAEQCGITHSSPSVSAGPDVLQDTIGPLDSQGTLLSQIQLAVNQSYQISFHGAAYSLSSLQSVPQGCPVLSDKWGQAPEARQQGWLLLRLPLVTASPQKCHLSDDSVFSPKYATPPSQRQSGL